MMNPVSESECEKSLALHAAGSDTGGGDSAAGEGGGPRHVDDTSAEEPLRALWLACLPRIICWQPIADAGSLKDVCLHRGHAIVFKVWQEKQKGKKHLNLLKKTVLKDKWNAMSPAQQEDRILIVVQLSATMRGALRARL